jgi:simple sugar transport system substrate-binding protein
MFRSGKTVGKRTVTAAAALACTALIAAGCSSTGGAPAQSGGGGGGGGQAANTPRITIAYITHQSPGDTFWDIVRKGAEAAAAKDNVDLKQSNDPDPGKLVTLIQNAIDSKVAGIALTIPYPDQEKAVIEKARAANIPVVAFNSGLDDWQNTGAMMYFGSDENLAGETGGKRIAQEGGKKALCVVQQQGHVALEARCAGLEKGMQSAGGTVEKLYVTGTNMPSVTSTVQAKLAQDPSIDWVITLGAPFALALLPIASAAPSKPKVATFDSNKDLPAKIKSGEVQWAIDQQPYLQGYLAVDSLWLYINNGNVIGGGQTTKTGPAFIDKSNIDAVEKFAANGTR